MNRRVWLAAVAGVTMLMSGCGQQGIGPAGPPRDDTARLNRQAHDALARWDQAVARAGKTAAFVPIGELTAQVGDWEDAVGDNNKGALGTGMVHADIPLPDAPSGTADVRWDNGTTQKVPTVSASDALKQVIAEGNDKCAGCTPLEVTGARFTTVKVATTKGSANAPAWEFTLRGTRVKITRVAVANAAVVTVSPPPWDSLDAPVGYSIDSAVRSADGRQLTVNFVAAGGTSARPCGADYTARGVESDAAVVVIIVEHGYDGPDPEACTMVGYPRTATVELDRPLGDRVVLEVMQGMPVTVTAG
jgi:hypothetical protein